MTRYGLGWLFVALGLLAVVAPACGGDDDDVTAGAGGKAGSSGGGGGVTGGASGTGGSAGRGGTAGKGGKGGGTSKDAGTTGTPCGSTTCPTQSMTPLCDTANGRCVECLSSANCPFTNRTACNPATHTCVQCVDDSTCPMASPYCDVPTNSCRVCTATQGCTRPQVCVINGNNATCQLRCMSDGDCAMAPMNNRACNLATMMCVQCQNNTHCVGNANGPACVGTTCRQCVVDADCTSPGLPVCIANACVACRTNAQCAEPTPVCVSTGANANTCHECGNNAECVGRPGGGACVTNVCRQCSTGATGVPCPAGSTCTMNTCVAIPEAGPPEAGRDATGDTSTDARTDVTIDVSTEAGPRESGAPDTGGN
ncbi:MAG TPA: hypothetical protein VK550_28950 [Polyangiaceae bacterium]|nr:hypothetical protein [Polyangiaceae bacterium]